MKYLIFVKMLAYCKNQAAFVWYWKFLLHRQLTNQFINKS